MTVLYIDESKAVGYTVVAAVIAPADAVPIRKAMISLRMSGQQRIHFSHESDSRRRLVLSTLVSLGVRGRVYRVVGLAEPAARRLCPSAVVADAPLVSATRLVIEQDDSYIAFDRRAIRSSLQELDARQPISYVHERAASEPLLWIADAIAWSFSRGGTWRQRVLALVDVVRDLS